MRHRGDMNAEALLFVGTHGFVTALDKVTGKELWRTSLPGTGYSIVSLLFEEGILFAASGGHVFALNPLNGDIAWENALPGLGTEALCIATTRSHTSGDATVQAAVDEARRRAASTTTTTPIVT